MRDAAHAHADTSVDLAAVEPARSRHAGKRSAVALTPDIAVVGTADGTARAFDRSTLDERWRADAGDAALVSAESFADGVVVGERGPEGELRLHDATTGAVRWRYRTADDVGEPVDETRFQLPFVASLAASDGRLYAAARRYERVDGERRFESVVYAFGPNGTVVWRFGTDASPISVAADADRVAVAYNRCPGNHQHGLVVLDAATGAVRWTWDPGTDGDRRVGDVSLCREGVAVASHGDYRGYRLGPGGTERWRVDLATPVDRGDERLYAYPNHVHATDTGVVFVTGNTYAADARETDGLHPAEHTAFGYAPDGERRWSAPVGGFAGEVGTDGDGVAVPGAQHFRRRDPDAHGLRRFGVVDGPAGTLDTDGVVVAAALDGDTVAAVEEPVAYHDGDGTVGAYRLHIVG